MTDPKVKDFAEVLVDKAAEIEEGDNVYLIAKSLDALPLFEEVRKRIILKGGFPHEHLLYDSQLSSEGIDHNWIKYASEEQLETVSEAKKKEMDEMDAYIRIGGDDNTKELSDLDAEKISKRKKATQDILSERLRKKWVTTRWPTDAMAQNADMSTQGFREFVFDAVTEVDWEELEERNAKIKRKFDEGEKVRIVAEDTDLSFSIAERDGDASNGNHNIPDGEVFYAPRKYSAEGEIRFSFPGVANRTEVDGIWLKFEDGKVVDYSAEKNEEFLEKMLKTDNGAKYIGEFGIGTNREIQQHVKNTLFDEKIGGTIHLALGRAYEKSLPDNEERNESGIHWDIVQDLRDNGKIFLDGEIVQENGEWVF